MLVAVEPGQTASDTEADSSQVVLSGLHGRPNMATGPELIR